MRAFGRTGELHAFSLYCMKYILLLPHATRHGGGGRGGGGGGGKAKCGDKTHYIV